MTETLAERIKRIRLAHEISVRAMSREVGMSTSTVIAAIRGDSLAASTVEKLAAWCAERDVPSTPELEGEVWRTIPDYDGYYEASSLGRIRSVERTVNHPQGPLTIMSRVLALSSHRSGHKQVDLSGPDGRAVRYVHRLVLEAFVGPRPDGMVACHYDGDPTNNHIENLRWDTYAANSLDAVRHGTHPGLMQNRAA